MRSVKQLDMKNKDLKKRLSDHVQDHNRFTKFGYLYVLLLISIFSLLASFISWILLHVEIRITRRMLDFVSNPHDDMKKYER